MIFPIGEPGQFTRAVTTAQAAIELASAAGAKEDVDYLRGQLEHYKSMELAIGN